MSDEKITSRHNALVRHARALRDRREAGEQIFIEGLRLSEDAVCSRLVIQDVLYTEKLEGDERGARLLNELKKCGARLALTSEEVLASVSDTRTPQGIVLLASRPHTGRDALLTAMNNQDGSSAEFGQIAFTRSPLIVIIHGINNPSNAGAILRTAEAAGASGVISTAGTTDLFSPRALRGAMGSSFRLPLWTGADFSEVIGWCSERVIRTTGASLWAVKAHTELDWTVARALVVGAEASGLKESELNALDEAVRIPMRPPVESLNAAVATGIILYEAARQRVEGRMGDGV
jgi:TrmH family RNA methyltransferase